MNILTDLCLILLPLMVVKRLQASFERKRILMLFFLARIRQVNSCVIDHDILIEDSVVASTVCQIVYQSRLRSLSDWTFDVWPAVLCMQIVQCLSILTTCLVYMRPFIDSLETGFIKVDDLRRQHVEGFGYDPGPGNSGGSKEANLGHSLSSLKSKLSKSHRRDPDIELIDRATAEPPSLGNISTIDGGLHNDWDAHSQSRILRTRTLTVE